MSLRPDLASMTMYHPGNGSQAYSITLILLDAMQTLKWLEQFV